MDCIRTAEVVTAIHGKLNVVVMDVNMQENQSWTGRNYSLGNPMGHIYKVSYRVPWADAPLVKVVSATYEDDIKNCLPFDATEVKAVVIGEVPRFKI